MSYEKLYPLDPMKALSAYRAALSLIGVAASDFAISPPPTQIPGAKSTEQTPFLRFRELWRWVDRLMWRAIVICARTNNVLLEDAENAEPDQSLWTWLKHYSRCSSNWPPDFRTAHRSTISVIYLQALVITHGRSLRSSMPITPVSSRAKKMPAWLDEACSVINSYRSILNITTKFPQAGDHNNKVEDFVDLCAAVWESAGAFGEHANRFIDVSYRISFMMVLS